MRQSYIRPRTILTPILFLFIHIMTASMVTTFFVLLGSLGFLPSVHPASPTLGTDITLQYLGLIASVYSVIQIVVYGLWLRNRQRFEQPIYYFDRKGRPGHWLAATVIMIGVLGFSMIQFNWMEVIAQVNDSFATYLDDYSQTMETMVPNLNLGVEILYLVILVPVAEELLFRGIIMAELKRAMPAWIAILLNGVLFAVFHWNPVQSVYTFVAGLAIAAIYMWSESLLMAIVMHGVFNFFGGIVPGLVSGHGPLEFLVVVGELLFIFAGILAAVWFYLNRRYQGEGDFFETKRLTRYMAKEQRKQAGG